MISVYADGSSTGRADGPGGWAYVLVRDGEAFSAGFGGQNPATNNQMELMAAIRGLERLAGLVLTDDAVELVSDSQYVLGLASGAFTAAKNQALVARLLLAVRAAGARKFRWVRGHAGDEFNERVDRLAKMGKSDVAQQKL